MFLLYEKRKKYQIRVNFPSIYLEGNIFLCTFASAFAPNSGALAYLKAIFGQIYIKDREVVVQEAVASVVFFRRVWVNEPFDSAFTIRMVL